MIFVNFRHWHVYLRWNKLLFREAYLAHLAGRSDKDPLDSWYQGELGFFDFYIIPLAKKLKECGVFGVASEEYLNYALTNRSEWERKGHSVVEAYRLEFVTSRVCRVDSKVSPLPKEPVSLQFLEGESANDSSICIKGNATKKSTITDLK